MPRYIPLQRQLHTKSGWKPVTNFSFAKDKSLVPLLVEELSHVLPHMAIAFSENKHVESGFELVGVLSLQPNTNLFVHTEGHWLGAYVPAVYRGYPFALLREEDTDNLHLCVDTESEFFHEDIGNDDLRVLDNEGNLADEVAKVVSFLQQCYQNRLLTHKLVKQLVDSDLLEPWKLAVELPKEEGSAEKMAVEGLFQISKEALDALPADKLHELHQSGALSMAYCQMWSKPRLSNLTPLYQVRSNALKQQQAKEPDLDQLFGEAEEDIFKF